MKVQIAPWQWAIFRGKDMPGHARRYCAVTCAKMAEWIEMPFGLWTLVGQRKHTRILGGVHIGTIWQILLNHPCAAAMRHFCQISLTTCYSLIILISGAVSGAL